MRDYLGFFILVGGTLFSLFVVWFGLKQYGLSRALSTYQTPLVEKLLENSKKQPLIWSDDPANLSSPPAQLIRMEYVKDSWAPYRITRGVKESIDGFLITEAPLLILLKGGGPTALPKLREFFNKNSQWKKVVFCSRSEGLLRDLRELEPKWTFCSSEAFLIRMLAFSSLELESLIDIKADVFFVHLSTTLSPEDIKALIVEAQRQNKFVIVGPVSRPLEGLFPDGWLVEDGDQKVQ